MLDEDLADDIGGTAEITGIVMAPMAVPMPGNPFTKLPTPIAAVVAVLAGMIDPAKLAITDLPTLSENGTP
jgi:hypothetical protein